MLSAGSATWTTWPNAEPGDAHTPRSRLVDASDTRGSTPSTGAATLSPHPSANSATNALIAAAASSPAALTCKVSPCTVCSAMIATSDLALALWVCLCR